jgi:acyl-CoA thioesterase-1
MLPGVKTLIAICFLLAPAAVPALAAEIAKRVLILGDSISEGYGVSREAAYPALLQEKLQAAGYAADVVNGGISGSTTASAVSRLRWHLKNKPYLVLIELGANDGLRGLSPEQTEKNLAAVIELALSEKVKVILAGMRMPPNYGKDYTRRFAAIFPHLAARFHVPLIPFLLEGVAGVASLNQADGIHPNPEGHRRVAELVLPYLEKNL